MCYILMGSMGAELYREVSFLLGSKVVYYGSHGT